MQIETDKEFSRFFIKKFFDDEDNSLKVQCQWCKMCAFVYIALKIHKKSFITTRKHVLELKICQQMCFWVSQMILHNFFFLTVLSDSWWKFRNLRSLPQLNGGTDRWSSKIKTKLWKTHANHYLIRYSFITMKHGFTHQFWASELFSSTFSSPKCTPWCKMCAFSEHTRKNI